MLPSPSPKQNDASSTVVGIDLGTTYSCVALYEHGDVTIITNSLGNRTTPSVVAYVNGERIVGEVAKQQAARNPRSCIFDSKRMIGRAFTDPSIQSMLPMWPFKVHPIDGKPRVSIEVVDKGTTTQVAPEEVSAAILLELKRCAESYLGRPVNEAVVTVPAYFNDAQRQNTRDAGTIAGLTIRRIINEPTAAALAYGVDKATRAAGLKNLLVFDLGGGTLDVTVLTVDNGIFECLSTHGNTQLGGQDFDTTLMQYCADKFQSETGSNVLSNVKAMNRLRAKCQEAKHALSTSTSVCIDVDALCDGHDFELQLTRDTFVEICKPLLDQCIPPIELALKDAQLSKDEIDDVILIGGSTRILEVQRRVSDYFDGKTLCKRINADEAVAYGAAIQAANLTLTSREKANTRLDGLTLMDVTPFSLGIELAGGKMSVLIPRNTTVPFSHTRQYYNDEDGQTYVSIEIFEGENPRTEDNRQLGCFVLNGIPPRPRGQVQVLVTFALDANGILKVSAVVKDLEDVKAEHKLSIKEDKGLLSQAELAEMAARLQA